ncbi:hypothetical protein [Methylobacterium nodulans]|uniref:Uncharacterized protein n=1 Tax=Methylobacterium nodulans (strain LMG 21967 / CNCM I-2342 / ORS 2060) TaxID=460265 RepID=B8IMJ8_METNO|nr:hypothetical protein [Methylobacterium nodulans]ACL58384.1 conserved hypothetical protein [Methylobacterium nodulans ORS 2060]
MNHLLKDTGEALYGPRWQTDLSHDLKVSDRTMRRWAAESADLPPSVTDDLVQLCEERIVRLQYLVERLKAAAAHRATSEGPPP